MLKILCVALAAAVALQAAARSNAPGLNRAYADQRSWHLGFSVGLHTQDFVFTHNGYVTPGDGQSWFMEQPSFSPGFCVTGLVNLRLNTYFSLRFTPGMYFGNRTVIMHDVNSGSREEQDIKSNLVVVPVDVKFSALRYRNARPYLVAGAMATFDVSRRRSREPLQLNTADFLLTAGFGCDFYLPFFKLCPEIKFCFGLTDVLSHDRPDFQDDPDGYKFTHSLKKLTSQMVVLSFYFE